MSICNGRYEYQESWPGGRQGAHTKSRPHPTGCGRPVELGRYRLVMVRLAAFSVEFEVGRDRIQVPVVAGRVGGCDAAVCGDAERIAEHPRCLRLQVQAVVGGTLD